MQHDFYVPFHSCKQNLKKKINKIVLPFQKCPFFGPRNFNFPLFWLYCKWPNHIKKFEMKCCNMIFFCPFMCVNSSWRKKIVLPFQKWPFFTPETVAAWFSCFFYKSVKFFTLSQLALFWPQKPKFSLFLAILQMTKLY